LRTQLNLTALRTYLMSVPARKDGHSGDPGCRDNRRLHARWRQPALVTECHLVLGTFSRKTPNRGAWFLNRQRRRLSADCPIRFADRFGTVAGGPIQVAKVSTVKRARRSPATRPADVSLLKRVLRL